MENKENNNANEHNKEAFLTTVSGDMEAGMMESLLNSYGIPVMRKYSSLDGFMKIKAGMLVNRSIDIYVPSSLLEKAKEIISEKFK